MKLQSKELALKKKTQKENVERQSSHIKNEISIISTHSSLITQMGLMLISCCKSHLCIGIKSDYSHYEKSSLCHIIKQNSHIDHKDPSHSFFATSCSLKSHICYAHEHIVTMTFI